MWNMLREVGAWATALKLESWLGLYGALLSSLLAARELRRRTRVKVLISVGDTVGVGPNSPPHQRWVRIKIINLSDHPVRLDNAGFWLRGETFAPALQVEGTEIAPQDSHTIPLNYSDVMRSRLRGQRVHGFVKLTTGDTFRSRRSVLLDPAADLASDAA